MHNHSSHYIKNLFLPCICFSVVSSILITLLITLFEWVTEHVIGTSLAAYSFVRSNASFLPLLLLGAALIGLVTSFILSFSHSCRGGGIPTSIAAIRGITRFHWYKSVFILPISAWLSFLCGLPLGTEGPCVQMGTAMGEGVVRMLGGKKHEGWRRYIMTGGASAAFSLVTGAPITAVIFSMEELHSRFSPLLFSVASVSVIAAQLSAHFLSSLQIGSIGLFHIDHIHTTLPLSLLFIPLVLGILCGACSRLFTYAYHHVDRLVRVRLEKISVKIKFPIIFSCIALIGFFMSEILGTGHSLIEALFMPQTVWYLLIIILLVRAILMIIANTAGITGGIFLPTLAFGAILGSLSAQAFIALGVIGTEHYLLLVILGMTAFLGATSRIPLTACVFAIEALCGVHSVLAVIIAVCAAFWVVELSGLEDFVDTVVKSKEYAIHKGKEPHFIEVSLTVHPNAFVIGKELRDILWPASCVVLSVERPPENKEKHGLAEGDVLTVHYKTYNLVASAEEFEVLVGDQPEHIDRIMRPLEKA